MKFQRINDKVIRCIISREEMDYHGVKIEDLMDNRMKAEEFLQYVLSEARMEMDFQTKGDVLNVQLSIMKDGELSMMISDDHNAAIRAIAEQFQEKLLELQQALEQNRKKKGKQSEDPIKRAKQRFADTFLKSAKDGEQIELDFWANLSELDDCILLAKALEDQKDAFSALYRYHDTYYFHIILAMTKDEIVKNVFIISEYAKAMGSAQIQALIVQEQGECVLKENAIAQLLELA